ncbi:hypothetical protein Tco_1217897 [Tanacetum coccineum]
MSPGLSASMAEVATMSESAFHKRFRSSYESSPSSSPPDLPSRKHYQGTSELVEDDDEEDEEIEESLDSNSVSEDTKGEGPTAEDGDPATGDKGLTAGAEGPGMGVESRGLDDEGRGLDGEGHNVESDGLGLGEDEALPEGQQQTVSVMGTAVSAPLGLGYGALRRRELALKEDHVYSTFEVGHGSRSTPEPERPERVSASNQPTLTTWIVPEDGMVYIDVPAYPPPAPSIQTPPSPEWSSGLLPIFYCSFAYFITHDTTDWGLIRDHAVRLEELLPTFFERSLEHEQERVAMTFGALWRPVLALESWAGQTDAQRAALWHAISDT